MARIVVITHEHDAFLAPRRFWQRRAGNYLLFGILDALAARGHEWRVVKGPRRRPADAAILHVDSTHVDPAYLALAAHYEVTINFNTSNISKRHVSGALLSRHDDWRGPVIVKSDLNHGGLPEAGHNARAAALGRALPHPDGVVVPDYAVLPGLAAVPAATWADPAFVVERFIPERDPAGYALRHWVFAGAAERCTRRVSPDRMVKANNSTAGPATVPEALRAERARLGFDYGKFDFVIHDGAPVLLDANRTPGRPPYTGATARRNYNGMADGLETMLRQR